MLEKLNNSVSKIKELDLFPKSRVLKRPRRVNLSENTNYYQTQNSSVSQKASRVPLKQTFHNTQMKLNRDLCDFEANTRNNSNM